MATLWPLSFQVQVDLNGALAPRAKAFFYDPGTTALRTVFAKPDLSTPHTNPVVADGVGRFPAVYLPYGDYKVRGTDEWGATLFEGDGISNPAPSAIVGGGGGDVSSFVTGDLLFQDILGVKAGWVRNNGKTIGSATSGATERANGDTQALFEWLWNNFPNTLCPVTGGRGVSAAADYLANKAIATPDLRGRVAIGVDDMGGGASNRLQVATQISTTVGSPAATVTSGARIGIGMAVVSADVPVGATVTAINGTAVTLSVAATGTNTGTDARFSYFPDATAAGQVAGRAEVALVEDELAAHSHGGVTGAAGAHTHKYIKPSLNLTGAAGVFLNGVAVTPDTLTDEAPAHTHTIAASGKGLPHTNLPPVFTGSWFRRL